MSRTARNRAEDKLWETIQEVIPARITPKEFLVMVANAWEQALKDEIKQMREIIRWEMPVR